MQLHLELKYEIIIKTKYEEEGRRKIERKEKECIEAPQSEVGKLENKGQLKRSVGSMKPKWLVL